VFHVKKYINKIGAKVFSQQTIKLIKYDLERRYVRSKRKKNVYAYSNKLHLGCGKRIINGWLNVDIENSDYNVDLGAGVLPWADKSFDAVVSQHVIEHLDLRSELFPLMKEIRRVMKKNGELWISCPDILKACESYLNHRMLDLIEDRKTRFPNYNLHGAPPSQFINDLFHQGGKHKNLFDYEILSWLLASTGFSEVERVDEHALLDRFPEFPHRGDDSQSIYVRAIAS